MSASKVIRTFKDKDSLKVFEVGATYRSEDENRIEELRGLGYLANDPEQEAQDNDSLDDLLAQSADNIAKVLAAGEQEVSVLQTLLEKETAGKNRKSVVEVLKGMIEKLLAQA